MPFATECENNNNTGSDELQRVINRARELEEEFTESTRIHTQHPEIFTNIPSRIPTNGFIVMIDTMIGWINELSFLAMTIGGAIFLGSIFVVRRSPTSNNNSSTITTNVVLPTATTMTENITRAINMGTNNDVTVMVR